MSRAKPLNDAQKQIQSQLFTLTYGVLVAQILEDVEDPKVVNAKESFKSLSHVLKTKKTGAYFGSRFWNKV